MNIRPQLLFLAISLGVICPLASCDSNTSKPGQYLGYINYDSLEESFHELDTTAVDSMYTEKYDSIIYSSIFIDSIKYYIVEGDMLLDEHDYLQYQLSKIVTFKGLNESCIIVDIENGQIVRWPENYVIRYSIAPKSFRTIQQYMLVKANIQKATEEWAKTCNVKFFYDEKRDPNNLITPSDDLTFVVVGFEANANFIAASFFPNEPPSKRRLLVDPSYFSTEYDKIGVFRHELGHILGFRHEHISKEAPFDCRRGKYAEDASGTTRITLKYDPTSVMHYFCGGMGTLQLQITQVDVEGSQAVYGPSKK